MNQNANKAGEVLVTVGSPKPSRVIKYATNNVGCKTACGFCGEPFKPSISELCAFTSDTDVPVCDSCEGSAVVATADDENVVPIPEVDRRDWLANLKQGDRVEVPYSLTKEDIKLMTVYESDGVWIRLLPDGFSAVIDNTVLVNAVSGVLHYAPVRIVPPGSTDGKMAGSSIPCMIRTEGGPEGGQPSRLKIVGAFSVRGAIGQAVTVAKALHAFVDFSIAGVQQQVCWTSNVDTILALHERQRDHQNRPPIPLLNVDDEFTLTVDQIDRDENDEERTTPCGSVWRVAELQPECDLIMQYSVVCDSTGAWVHLIHFQLSTLGYAPYQAATLRNLSSCDCEGLAEAEFIEYDFGEGVQVLDHGRWDISDSADYTKITYLEYDDDAPEADSHKVTFHVRFTTERVVAEVFALEVDSGNLIGKRRLNAGITEFAHG